MQYPIRLICGWCDGRGFTTDAHHSCNECHGKGDLNEEVDDFYYLKATEMFEEKLRGYIDTLEKSAEAADYVGDHNSARTLTQVAKSLKSR